MDLQIDLDFLRACLKTKSISSFALNMSTSPQRTVESLILHCFKGQGLLLRLYDLKQELGDSSSDLSFLRNDKPFVALSKAIQNSNNGWSNAGFPKQRDEMNRVRIKIEKYLVKPFETLLDTKLFLQSAEETLKDCNCYLIDTSRVPDFAKLFLDLVVLHGELALMTSRIEERKTICLAVEMAGLTKGLNVGSSEFQEFCKFMNWTAKPLLYTYECLKDIEKTLRNAFLSSITLAYVRHRSSIDQWRKEDFLAFNSMIGGQNNPGSETEDLKEESVQDATMAFATCLGYPSGVESVDLTRMEKWFFYGFLHCHAAVDISKKESGEYKLWSLLLQGSWVLPIFRTEVLWMHEELGCFFKALKKQKNEHGLGKKAHATKDFSVTAFKLAPRYHYFRRLYLTGLLRHYCSALSDQPALLGPKYAFVHKLLSLCNYELFWAIRHQEILRSLAMLQRDFDMLVLIYYMQEVRNLFHDKMEEAVIPYFQSYIAGFDIPSLTETLTEEVAKINDPELKRNPLYIVLKRLESIELVQFQEDGSICIQNDMVTKELTSSLAVDLMRLQANLVSHPNGNESRKRIKRAPSTTLTKQIDSVLNNLHIVTACLSTGTDLAVDPLSRIASQNVGFQTVSSLTDLPLAYPETFKTLVGMSLHSMCPETFTAISFVQILDHFSYSSHSLCPENFEKCNKYLGDMAASILKQITITLKEHFKVWTDYSWQATRSLLPSSDGMAIKVARVFANKRSRSIKSQKTDSSSDLEKLIKTKAAIQHKEKVVLKPVKVEMSFRIMTQLCQALSQRQTIKVGSVTFAPKEFFLQALDSHFVEFIQNSLEVGPTLTASITEYPLALKAKLDNFVWSLLHLLTHFSTEIDAASLLFRLLSKLHESYIDSKAGLSVVATYARDYLCSVFTKAADRIVQASSGFIWSETFQSFVLHPTLAKQISGNQKSEDENLLGKAMEASAMIRFMSESELRALCEVFGTEGINYLFENFFIKHGINKELMALKNLCLCTGDVNASLILSKAINIGSYIALRNKFSDALSETSEEKIGFLQTAAKLLYKMEEPELMEKCLIMTDFMAATTPLENCEFALGEELLQDENIRLTHDESVHLCSILAHCIPHAAKLSSSEYVSTVKLGNENSTCIDGFCNNLNMLALGLVHLLTVLDTVTIASEDTFIEESLVVQFIKNLSKSILDYEKIAMNEKEKHNPNLLVIPMILKYFVDKNPNAKEDVLQQALPLPFLRYHHARNKLIFDKKHSEKSSYPLKSISEESSIFLNGSSI